jgi:hypothetical protein
MAIEVVDQASYNTANEISERCKITLKKIDESCDPVIEAAHKAHKAALAQKKAIYAPIEAVRRDVDAKMTTWFRAEQRRIADERAKKEAEARKKAEDEAIKKAEELSAQGMSAAADDILEQPVVVDEVIVEEIVKADGVFYRTNYSARIIDLMELVRAVASGKQPLSMLLPNETYINSIARATKGTQAIPGVVFESTQTQGRRL